MKNVMNLTPEEKFYSEVWKLLEKIKEKYLATPKKQPPKPENNLFCEPHKPHGVEIWLNYGSLFNQQRNIIYKLQEWKSLKVLDETRGDLNYEGTRFIFKILQPRFNKIYQSWEKINENPWLSEENKIVQIKKVLGERQKQSKKNKINFPTDPDVIEEYLNILNRIERERQRTPAREPIAFPIPKGIVFAKGVPLPEQETSILRILEGDGIIKITQKTRLFVDSLGLDPYENSETIRAVIIPDLKKFENYRDKLSELKNQSGKSYKERKADTGARAKEIKRQLGEGVEKERKKEALKKELIEEVGKKIKKQIKPFEELGRQISSQAQKDFKNFGFKQYRKFIEKIDEQAGPMKRALEQFTAVYSDSVQNFLTPALQRLIESIKPIEEEMKRLNPLFEYPEYPKEAFISSDVMRARQGAETILKLENIEALLQGLLSKDKKKPKQVEIIEEIQKEKNENKKTTGRSFCITEGKWGYLKFYKQGKKIKIGGINSRHFRLLQCLYEPLGVFKTIDSAFEAIRLPKDTDDSRLGGFSTSKNRKIEKVQYSIKELQKIKELQGKLKFTFDYQKRYVKLEVY